MCISARAGEKFCSQNMDMQAGENGTFQMKRNLRNVVVLVFYGPSTHFRSYRDRSINLATLFLGKCPRQFTRFSDHSFTSN